MHIEQPGSRFDSPAFLRVFMGTKDCNDKDAAPQWEGYTMKLRIQAKLMSVHSEVEVKTTAGEVRYVTETDPLSAPRRTFFRNARGDEIAQVTTVRLDTKDRAHRVVMADGRTFELKRKFRSPASTAESYLTISGTDWKVAAHRAWTSRFEVRNEAGGVLAEAKQVPAERGDVYDLVVKDAEDIDELVLIALITRYIMREDAPVPTAR